MLEGGKTLGAIGVERLYFACEKDVIFEELGQNITEGMFTSP